jgi:hypothetical protein
MALGFRPELEDMFNQTMSRGLKPGQVLQACACTTSAAAPANLFETLVILGTDEVATGTLQGIPLLSSFSPPKPDNASIY